MKLITIIVPYTNLDKVNEFKKAVGDLFNEYAYKFIFLHEKENEELKSSKLAKFVKVEQGLSYSKQITIGFEHIEGDAVMIVDMNTENYVTYVQNMLESYQKGAKIVKLKYKRSTDKWYHKITDFFVKLKNKIFNMLLRTMGMNSDDNCYNTFQMFDREAFSLIKAFPEQNAYLRNSTTLDTYERNFIYTSEKLNLKNEKMHWNAEVVISLILACLMVLTFISTFILIPLASKVNAGIRVAAVLIFVIVALFFASFYLFYRAFLRHKFNR